MNSNKKALKVYAVQIIMKLLPRIFHIPGTLGKYLRKFLINNAKIYTILQNLAEKLMTKTFCNKKYKN